MTDEETAVQRARSLFDGGAEVIYVGVGEVEIWIESDPPDRPGVFVSARSVGEVRRYLRDLKFARLR